MAPGHCKHSQQSGQQSATLLPFGLCRCGRQAVLTAVICFGLYASEEWRFAYILRSGCKLVSACNLMLPLVAACSCACVLRAFPAGMVVGNQVGRGVGRSVGAVVLALARVVGRRVGCRPIVGLVVGERVGEGDRLSNVGNLVPPVGDGVGLMSTGCVASVAVAPTEPTKSATICHLGLELAHVGGVGAVDAVCRNDWPSSRTAHRPRLEIAVGPLAAVMI